MSQLLYKCCDSPLLRFIVFVMILNNSFLGSKQFVPLKCIKHCKTKMFTDFDV